MSEIFQAQALGLRSLPRKQVTVTLVGVLLAMFLASLDQTVVSTAMPRIVSDLGGFNQYTWITTAYMITSAIAVPIVGKLTDIYGRKNFYIGGLIIFILGSVACGLSQNIFQIIIFRGFQGIGAGVMMANAFTVIGDLFPPAVRGKYQGLMSSTFALSSIIGPTLGGFITDALSWHWVFFVNVPLGVAVIVLFIWFFPQIRPDNLQHKIDYAGVALLVVGVVPALLALTWGGVEYPWVSAPIIGMFVFAAAALIFFILVERRSPEPIVPMSLFKNRIVAIAQIMTFLTSFGMFGSTIFVPLFFQGVLGATATTSGNFLTPMMLGVVTGSFLSGQFLSRTGGHYRTQGMVGMVIVTAGFFLLSRMGVNSSYGAAVRNVVIAGFGMGITMPLYIIAVQNVVPYKFLGTATSANAFMRSIGGTVGLAIFGSVLNNRFSAELTASVPAQIRTAIPPSQFDVLVHNPQALFSPEAQAQLQSVFSNLGDQGAAFFQELLNALRFSLDSAISNVFFYAFIIMVLAFIINLFIKEVPLRAHYAVELQEDKEESQPST